MTLTGNYLQIGGTYDQNADFSIGGNFSQGGGAFVSNPANTFTVGNNFSLSGGTFNRFTGLGTGMDPYLIYDIYGLQGMAGFLSSIFGLANDIDASTADSWNLGTGFTPIGNNSTPFTGTFNGNSYTISNLFINLPTTNDVGLFGYTSGATIENVGLVNANITGQSGVGALVGYATNSSSIDNGYATGSVSGANYVGGLVGLSGSSSSIDNSYATVNVSGVSGSLAVGGLVGLIYSSSVDNSYANGNVSGTNNIGGLVGSNYKSSIDNSYATGSVSGSNSVGGLVGSNYNSSIGNSYATGSVSGSGNVGGLVGSNYNSSIDNSYATGSVRGSAYIVSGSGNVGGLVGANVSSSISNSYATGSVSGSNSVGGLVGYNTSSSIDNSYATGSVSGDGTNVGGLVGYNRSSSSIDNSYATGSVSGNSNVGGLIGYDDGSNPLTNNWWYNSLSQGIGNNASNTSVGYWQEAGSASDFFNSSQAVYNGTNPWDISSTTGHIWAMSGDDDAYPLLQFRYATAIQDAYQLQLMFLNLGASYSLGNNIDAGQTLNWNSGGGFAPIGINSPFTGTFNGNGYTISNLFINLPSTNDVGLWGEIVGAAVGNVGLVNANITGQNNVGSLVGLSNNSSSIANTYATGSVSGNNQVGGLVGLNNNSSSIANSYTTGSASGNNQVGGLVGSNDGSSSITNSFAVSSASGTSNVGGLVGANDSSSTITNAYYTDSNNQNGLGTFDSNGAADFYSPFNPVYAIGTAGQWDFVFTPVWDAYTNELPHLHSEGYSGSAYPFMTWLGTSSSDFDTASNWSTDSVPQAGSTVIIKSAANEPILSGSTTLTNVLIGSGIFIQNGALTLSGNYDQAGGTFDQNTDLSIAGSYTNAGGTFNAGTQPVTFTGSGAITSGSTSFNNLAINATGTYALEGTTTVNGNLNIQAGSLTAPSGDLDVSGDWIHSGGTFNANNGDVVLTGTNQLISGNNIFYDLTKIDGGLDTLTFAAGDTQTVTGQLKLAGTDTNQLLLRSTSSPSRWLLNLEGTQNLSYLNVKDSQAIGIKANCRDNCTDAGNNIGWLFPPFTLTTQEQDDLFNGYDNMQHMSFEGKAGGGYGPGVDVYWIPYGKNGTTAYDSDGDQKWHWLLADHAVQESESVKLLPSSMDSYIQ